MKTSLRAPILLVVSAAVLGLGCPKKESAAPTKVDETADELPAAQPDEAPSTVKGEEVTYNAGETVLKGYLAYDEGVDGPRPGVLVVHEWWGHNEFARDRARALAEMGYTALAVDMFGDGKQAAHPDDAKKFATEVMGNIDEGVKRFEAAADLLKKHETTDGEKLAAIGYCFGGGIVLHMARIGSDLDAVASFHGSLAGKVKAEKGGVKAKLLVANGAADPFVKAEDVEAFQSEMKAADVDLKFISYDGAKHAFTNPGATELGTKFELPLAYNAEAAERSWAELETFLKSAFQ